MEGASQEFTWRDYLGPVIARRWLVAGIVVLVAAATYVYSASKPLVYKASTKLYVAAPANPALNVAASSGSDRAVQDEASLITTTGVASLAAKQIGYSGPPGNLLVA